jgi:hypothetical protein
MLDPSAADMFDAGNYRRRRTRRQRHAKMLLSGQFHPHHHHHHHHHTSSTPPSAFAIYPELIQRAHLQHAQAAFALSLESQQQQQQVHQVHNAKMCTTTATTTVIKADDYDDSSEDSDNDAAMVTAEQSHDTTKPINSLDMSNDHDATKFPTAANYLCNLDKLLKNQFFHQINFHTAINDCNQRTSSSSISTMNNNNNNSNTHADLMTRDNDSKMNLKSTNFTIENLIRK